jgi:3-methyladenine DNA glycosylase Tag
MDEFGETPSIYVWPIDHEEGAPFPSDFYERLSSALAAAGFGWETV